MARYVGDIETNGLLPELKVIHSLCFKDLDSGRRFSCTDASRDYMPVEEGLRILQDGELLVFHNGLSFDIKAIRKLYPWFSPRGVVRDTLVMAKMIWPMDRLKELDFPRWRKGTLPGQLIGAHKLEAWGYRLGRQKGEYSKDVREASKAYAVHKDLDQVPEAFRVLATIDAKGNPALDPWLAWNVPMHEYCDVDIDVGGDLFSLIEGHFQGTAKAAFGVGWSPESVETEHLAWVHIDRQTERGYGFDKEAAIRLAGELKTRQRELEGQLIKVFGEWWEPLDDPETGTTPARDHSDKMTAFPTITVRKFSEKTGKELKPYVGPPLCHYTTDAPFVRIKRTTFNPKSRQHLGARLQAVFGWKPSEFGGAKGDQAKVDETTIKGIKELPDDLRDLILEYLVVSKTLGQLADGKKSWIDLCGEDGRLHGRMDTLGTVSHRGAHFDPNLGQVPAVKKEKQNDGTEVPILGWRGGFGVECRTLFRPGVGANRH